MLIKHTETTTHYKPTINIKTQEQEPSNFVNIVELCFLGRPPPTLSEITEDLRKGGKDLATRSLLPACHKLSTQQSPSILM